MGGWFWSVSMENLMVLWGGEWVEEGIKMAKGFKSEKGERDGGEKGRFKEDLGLKGFCLLLVEEGSTKVWSGCKSEWIKEEGGRFMGEAVVFEGGI